MLTFLTIEELSAILCKPFQFLNAIVKTALFTKIRQSFTQLLASKS